ncbi:M15 family metallopeptidase [Sorangium sp. So ce131]|uniref:M15 family metallopeptidase n=1 Tax=Sorangium sp. So ce131 TaxID=3133282 RepID=UPI003F643BFD
MNANARTRVHLLVAAALALLAIGPLGIGGGPVAEAKEGARGKVKQVECRPQSPQKFLKRRTFVRKGMLDPKKHAKAVRYLAEHYGHVETEETRRYNPESAFSQATTVRFMGLPLSIHERVAPLLTCVEKRIRATCTRKKRYTPQAVGGFRTANSYRGAEISNHLFGIAIDIDPERNPCCGCVDPWPTSPLCQEKKRTAYERTALTRCWIQAFERYGFDWLGHDDLEDTMHFEFLGDPDRIDGRNKTKNKKKK